MSASSIDNKQYHIRLIIAIVLLSLSIIAYQLILMHFLSIVQWYHFAYMVISIALLGFGASGSIITIFRVIMLRNFYWLVPLSMILSGMFMTLATNLTSLGFADFDSYLVFAQQYQVWQLIGYYFLFFMPFFLGAMAIGLTFARFVTNIGSFYFADLAGAGLGGILVLFMFYEFIPEVLPSAISLVPVMSGILICKKEHFRSIFPIAAIALSINIYFLLKPVTLPVSDFKSINYSLQLPGAKIVYSQNSPYGLLQVVESKALRHAPGLSLTYTNEILSRQGVFNSGNWIGAIPTGDPHQQTHLVDNSLQSLPYAISKREKILLLNFGVGEQVFLAVRNGSESITCVEPNKMLVSLNKNEFARTNDSLFYHPFITVHSQAPRTFLAQDTARYDLIQLPSLGSFGGDAGLFALKEEFLLTKGAFGEMWNKLTSNGFIAISVWMQYPPRYSYKLMATIYEMLDENEVENKVQHVVAIRNWNMITVLIKKNPLNEEEKNSIKSFCKELNFDITVLDEVSKQDRTVYNDINDPSFFIYLDSLPMAAFRESMYNNYIFRTKPATDDQPYFSQFIKWSSFSDLQETFGGQAVPFFELGYFIVVLNLGQLSVLAILLVIAPLFKVGWKSRSNLWVLGYFTGLGIGYMFMELVLIEQFTLYLGQVIFSAAMVLSVMLISSGLGSYYSNTLRVEKRVFFKIIVIVIILIIVYVFGLEFILTISIGLPFYVRVTISVTIVALPSFFMGFLFPLGLKLVSDLSDPLVPWAWGINGAMSVVSTGLALIIAVELGFKIVFLLAAVAYGISLMSVFTVRKIHRV